MNREKLVEIKGLKTRFKIEGQWANAVDSISFDIYKGETLGIVGESGSGKSVSVLSLIQLIPNPPGEVSEGEIIFKGKKIFDGKDLNAIRKTPRYKYFQKIPEDKRKTTAGIFFVSWLIIHLLLPIPGPLFGLLSFILDLFVTTHLFFNSPRKKALSEFRNNTYSKMWDIRGKEIAMIFQEPMTSLNPVFSIGMQIIESVSPLSFSENVKIWFIRTARSLKQISLWSRVKLSVISGLAILFISQLATGWSYCWSCVLTAFLVGFALPSVFAYVVLGVDRLIHDDVRDRFEQLYRKGVNLLKMVGIPDAEKRMKDYPHQFSGGMRQRVMIAIALAKNPSLLIADEPTTALDVTIQAQILDLMLDLKKKNSDSAVVLITHDLAVVAETCERVIVMYGGIIQEAAGVEDLFRQPRHPYTQGLLNSIPRPDKDSFKRRLETIPGMVPNILDLPVGCKFCTRCTVKQDRCETEIPPLQEMAPGHFVRCFVAQEEQVTK